MKKILIIDDDVMTITLLERILQKENYETLSATTGKDALAMIGRIQVEGILLDLGLPDMDGMDVLKALRRDGMNTSVPVWILSGKDEEIDMILGLEMGADDYIVKPFRKRELLARMRAIYHRLERMNSRDIKTVKFGNVSVMPEMRQVQVDQKNVALSQKEFALLETLISYPNKVFTRDELLNIVWHEELAIEDRTVDVYIRRLRLKLEVNPEKPIWFETVRGLGYRFNG